MFGVTLNIHIPEISTLLVMAMLIMSRVFDPGTVNDWIPSPAFTPATAGVPPFPPAPPELSPVVHWIPLSA